MNPEDDTCLHNKVIPDDHYASAESEGEMSRVQEIMEKTTLRYSQ